MSRDDIVRVIGDRLVELGTRLMTGDLSAAMKYVDSEKSRYESWSKIDAAIFDIRNQTKTRDLIFSIEDIVLTLISTVLRGR